jgi:TfoX/Sxy family transcriptional regulator of competence genes
MATQQSVADFLVHQMADAGVVTARKMFGEYGIYCDGKMPAILSDDMLFVKPTPGVRALTEGFDEAPPYPGAKPLILIAEERWQDRSWLSNLIQTATAELPAPKPKPPRKKGPPRI